MQAKPVHPIPEGEPLKAVRMMNDRVLVEPPDGDEERRSRGGLVIPATAAGLDRKGVWGRVVAVGPNARTVEVGDEVLLLPESGIEVEIRGRDYVLVREREIHAVATEREDPGSGLYL
ncbi:MAG TPA: co-chaperone GroES [Actinomycetota bacterium]